MSDTEIKRKHTASHIMSHAVRMIWPNAYRGVGPWTDTGYYQDYDFGDNTISSDDFKKIEKKMRWIVNKNFKVVQRNLEKEKALEVVGGDPYKQELIEEIVQRGEELSFYTFETDDGKIVYSDLCAGPHLERTGDVGIYKLTRLAGAYWRGDEKNPQLTRIYGVAFEEQEQLDEYERLQEEAQRRDHRRLGKELDIFAFDQEVGPGLPLWLPNGSVLVEQLERLAKTVEQRQGYQRVRSPHIAKEELYLRSGHLPYYKDSMYPGMEIDEERYYLKAMNCPHHHKIFAATPKSYRDLPVRYAEYGHCYRFEDSGALFGLMRVRSLCMNDAHIYCTEEQFEEEFSAVINLYLWYFQLFGIDRYQMRLSKHSPEGLGEKYVDEPELWEKTEHLVRTVLTKLNVPFVEESNEAAFYGPKIDVQVWSAIGREFTLATNQLDFAQPARFELEYTDSDGDSKTPLCIHRAPLSTHERFIGFLIEHYGGAFPLWLAPVQAHILPVTPEQEAYGLELNTILSDLETRVVLTSTKETLGKRVRNAQVKKVPLTIILGAREQSDRSVTIRRYGSESDEQMSLAELSEFFRQQSWPFRTENLPPHQPPVAG